MTVDDLDAVLTAQEAGSVLALAGIFPQDRYPFPRAEVLERWRVEIADPAIGSYVSVGEDGAVNGYAATCGDELLHFGVSLACWGTGLARELHDATIAVLASTVPAQTRRVRLRVFEANGRARRFYEKLGWRPTGQTSRTSFEPHPLLLEYDRAL
jgi:RimJ/RimL family protein N-acetyltransferase